MIDRHKTPLKICFLAEIFYPEVKDGLTQHAYQLAESLISAGAELFVITRKMGQESRKFELVGNVPVRRIPPIGRLKGKGWNAVLPLMRLLTLIPILLIRYIKRYDIIFVSGVKILSIPAILMSIGFGKTSVIRIESPSELYEDISSDSLRRMKISKSSRIIKLLFKTRNYLVRKADCFIAISSEIRQQLIDIGVDDNKILCISNGINIKKFSPVPANIKSGLRQKLSLPEDAIIVVYSGRLVVSKGILLLLEVWKQLLLQNNNIHLLLVGSGKGSFDDCDREAYDYMVKQKLEKNVSLTGSVDNVNEYLMASDIFVLPSDYEGFSLALLEGLACALPSIATKVGGAADIIQNYKNGLLINPKDKEGLKTAIEWMLEQRPQWETMGKRARESAEKHSIEAVANTYFELFEHLKEGKISGNKVLISKTLTSC